MKKIVLFASGTGTNAENIIRHFEERGNSAVEAVFCNNPKAKVIDKLADRGIPIVLFSKEDLQTGIVSGKLLAYNPDLIVLAGFLLQLPMHIIEAYPNKIINIHPALLPRYGGKGMYGMHVHQAVLDNKEAKTGISIHYVDEHYDNGDLIFQKETSIHGCVTADEISEKIHELEIQYFPKVIEVLVQHPNFGNSDFRLKINELE